MPSCRYFIIHSLWSNFSTKIFHNLVHLFLIQRGNLSFLRNKKWINFFKIFIFFQNIFFNLLDLNRSHVRKLVYIFLRNIFPGLLFFLRLSSEIIRMRHWILDYLLLRFTETLFFIVKMNFKKQVIYRQLNTLKKVQFNLLK